MTFVEITPPSAFDPTGAVIVGYEILPTDGILTHESAVETERIATPHRWWLAGRDDERTRYEDRGGVVGVPPSGVVVDGNRSLFPAPPPAASWLEVDFNASERAEPVYTLRVDLPLPLAEQAGRAEDDLPNPLAALHRKLGLPT